MTAATLSQRRKGGNAAGAGLLFVAVAMLALPSAEPPPKANTNFGGSAAMAHFHIETRSCSAQRAAARLEKITVPAWVQRNIADASYPLPALPA